MKTNRDALGFHIADYIGKLAAENPGASFSIISKDTGFDPLVKHLKLMHIECKRSASIADIPHIKLAAAAPKPVPAKAVAKPTTPRVPAAKPVPKATAKPPADSARMTQVLENLGKRQGLPATLKTLRTTIASLFKPTLANDPLDELVAEMVRRGTIIVTGTKVRYALA